ncbi:hypothetical protein E2C01_068089 [Portunus trituberculatus]|uniref:Uncharacterized protein n=1 Tax=Portunus trituberculatus TaxID=210409 RepID=A0A5B7HR29_PORTR|nr:hypothetical protein [Portunus trituberculatus]
MEGSRAEVTTLVKVVWGDGGASTGSSKGSLRYISLSELSISKLQRRQQTSPECDSDTRPGKDPAGKSHSGLPLPVLQRHLLHDTQHYTMKLPLLLVVVVVMVVVVDTCDGEKKDN